MKLYLVRHGQAMPKDADPKRPLTETGMQSIVRLARFLKKAKAVSVAEIHHSGKLRARQTAETIANYLEDDVQVKSVPNLEPLAEVADLAETVQGVRSDLMLVGHLPHLGRLASRLVCGDEESGVFAFAEGGTVCLSRAYSDVQGGEHGPLWAVLWMVTPDLVA